MIRPYKGIVPTIAASSFVDESAQVIGDVTVGENASIWMNTVIRGDVNSIRIGANSNVQDGAVLHGMLNKWPVVVGEWVTIGHNATVHGCVIEDHCLIGMGSVILNGAHIGSNCIIAAGAVVPEGANIPSGSLVMGLPAKVRRALTEDDIKMIDTYAKHYLVYKEDYK